MDISLVYITKNEEKNIAKSINSCKNIADEIIVVDTGSTDKTIKICQELGCEVHNFKWVQDFAKARNYALDLCHGKFVLFLDADEYFETTLAKEDKVEMLKLLGNKYDGIAMPELDIDKDVKCNQHTGYTCKLFRNSSSIRYTGRIHEYVSNDNKNLKALVCEQWKLIHTGYSSSISKSKLERNLSILNILEDKTTMEYFYLARENLFLNNYEEAEKNINIFFKRKDVKKVLHSTNIGYLSYFYKCNIMEYYNKKYSKKDILATLEEARREFPFIPEVYYRLGLHYLNIDVNKSMNYFKQSILTNEKFQGKYFVVNNFVSFQPTIYHYIARILSLQGKRDEAIQKSIVSCMLDKLSHRNFGLLLHLLNKNKVQENISLINNIYRPKTKEDFEFIVKGLENTNFYNEFVQFAAEYNLKHKGGDDSVYYAMMLSNQYEPILDSLSKYRNAESEFIATVVLLYANSKELFDKYLKVLNLDSKYLDILNYLIKGEKSENIDIDILVKIICKLSVYGITDFPMPLMEYICKKCDCKHIIKLADINNNNREYETAQQWLTLYLNLNYLKSSKSFDEVISEFLFTLFENEQYRLFVDYYNMYLSNLQNKSIQEALVKILRDKHLAIGCRDLTKECKSLLKQLH